MPFDFGNQKKSGSGYNSTKSAYSSSPDSDYKNSPPSNPGGFTNLPTGTSNYKRSNNSGYYFPGGSNTGGRRKQHIRNDINIPWGRVIIGVIVCRILGILIVYGQYILEFFFQFVVLVAFIAVILFLVKIFIFGGFRRR